MKKTILLIALAVLSFWNLNLTYASDTVAVYVTEAIPWAWCNPVDKDWNEITKEEVKVTRDENWNEIPTIYKCNIKKGSEQVVATLWAIIKYFTYIAGLVWVLFIVANGIMYSMWWADQSLKDESKKRIIWTLVWLVVLLLSWPILQIIAPWIYK